ncbi:MAG: hypothetical protein ACTSQJ_03035 [Promethearchaeota archaeon]
MKKFSPEIKDEINLIISGIDAWQNLFSIKLDFFFDGWALYLKEKLIYPRLIVIFKSYEKELFSIKSFEVHFKNFQKEMYKELFKIENIKNVEILLKELKKIIYGKDIFNSASQKLKSI